VNEGENSVFPIQVSLRELLLFLGCCYSYGAYQNTGYRNAQAILVHFCTRFWAVPQPAKHRRETKPDHNEIEGEDVFPIQVHSGACYFYYGSCYLYFLYLASNCMSHASNKITNINQLDRLFFPISGPAGKRHLLPIYTALCNAGSTG